jgi:hypothetical protein
VLRPGHWAPGQTAEEKNVLRGLATVALLPLLVAAGRPSPVAPEKRLAFWDTPRRGANFFKWKGTGRDFLIGDASHFHGLVPEDLQKQEQVLGWAEAEGMPVVLGMLSLPGCRWRQLNGGRDDYRLWNEERFQEQAALNARACHWAFYSFREDAWDRMDYELGPAPLGAAYWKAVERGEHSPRPRSDNPLWRVLREGLGAAR